jgi:hypothetical protein
MPQTIGNCQVARAAICAAFGIFLVMAGGVATAYAEDDDALPDEKFMRSFLRGLGLRNGEEAGIEYKERSPLVLPPTRDLPVPAAVAPPPAKVNPAWPTDPDKVAEKQTKKPKKPIVWLTDVQQDRLTAEEWNAGRTPQAAPPGSPQGTPPAPAEPNTRPGASQAGNGNAEMTPKELGYNNTIWDNIFGFTNIFKSDKPESKPFVREPSRAALTDPPAGYRTPSPSQPYGLNSKETGVEAKGRVDPQTVRGN